MTAAHVSTQTEANCTPTSSVEGPFGLSPDEDSSSTPIHSPGYDDFGPASLTDSSASPTDYNPTSPIYKLINNVHVSNKPPINSAHVFTYFPRVFISAQIPSHRTNKPPVFLSPNNPTFVSELVFFYIFAYGGMSFAVNFSFPNKVTHIVDLSKRLI